MLSPLDDLPIHQVAETMATVGTSDRNFYDRCYFSMHGSTDEFFMAMGLGQYPNLDVTDAFICASYADKQTVVRSSRPLGLDRLDTRVGPLRVEVIEGLKKVRFVCEETEGFAVDAVWDGTIPAHEEPRMTMESSFGRQTMNTMRFLQTGTWTGTLMLDGREIEVTPDRFGGNRDRSWGVRAVGEPEVGGKPTMAANGFYWNYFVVRFEKCSIVYMCQEDGLGRRTLEEGVRLFPDGRVEQLGRPEHELRFTPGTRMVTGATVRFRDGLVLEGEALRSVHLARGSGYGFDADWRHGMYHGEDLVVQRVDFDLSDPAMVPFPGAIVDHLGRYTTNQGDGEGYGLLEVMTMGPHPQYFTAWDDVAS
ncbi:MAG: hypothetical protein JWO27_265 [Frankiales bacterium]|jgi:hypothetical protein|nr:hypothetical protein [Frankiales bacterium]MCW2709774.1 hypothetical protein [Frankiales bacterium]